VCECVREKERDSIDERSCDIMCMYIYIYMYKVICMYIDIDMYNACIRI